MNITFIDGTDLQNINQNKDPEFKSGIPAEKQDTVERYIELLKSGSCALVSFADKNEEETFLNQMSLKSDIGIVLEWNDVLKAYLVSASADVESHKVCLSVSGQPRPLYENGVERDYNRFKKWIKWLPAGYYHSTNLGGGPVPQSVGAGLEKLANSLGVDLEWQLRGSGFSGAKAKPVRRNSIWAAPVMDALKASGIFAGPQTDTTIDFKEIDETCQQKHRLTPAYVGT